MFLFLPTNEQKRCQRHKALALYDKVAYQKDNFTPPMNVALGIG